MIPINFDEKSHKLVSFKKLSNDYELVMGDVARYELRFRVPLLFGFIWAELKREVRFYTIVIEREIMENKWNKLIES